MFFIYIFSFGVVFSQNHVPVKHALVVAISEYSPSSGFRHIDADNDLKIIMKLLKQQGFTDTIILTNARATKEGFIEAYRKLRSNIQPGDIIYIHFSTHGQQIQDLGGDEIDGLDEAIALYDSQSRGSNEYRGQNHLTDDEFGEMIEQLRKSLGKQGDILVMIDACHSGSMSRGLDTVIIRGGYPPITIPGQDSIVRTRGSNDAIRSAEGSKSVGMFSNLNHNKRDDLANYVIISACENSEISSEFYYNHNYFGPLTWAFLTALLNNSSENYTYNKLFHDIQYEMISMFENYKTKQNPTIESAETGGTDKVIFGGKSIKQQNFYTISRFIKPDQIIIDGGNISGIFDSTTVTVYPSGTADPGKAGTPLAIGKIIQSGYMESTVQLQSLLNDKKPGDYWIFINDRRLGGYKVTLGLGTFTDAKFKKQAIGVIQGCSYAEITTDSPAFILEQKKSNAPEMDLVQSRSRKISRDNITVDNLGKTLLNLAQVQFMKSLKVTSQGIELDVALVPSDSLHNPKSKFTDSRTLRPTVKEGVDTAILWIANTGKKSFYFNLLDIDPEDRINVVFPSDERPVSDCYLQPGQKFPTRYTFYKPYGTETLKIIASDKKFDLRPVINSMSQTRGIMGEMEKLFSSAYNMRGSPSLPESTGLATFNFVFDIIK